jgi:hypothetical protein
MEDAHERRTEVAPRIPLDVMVSLAHPGLDEVFEADAVDVSPGGLAMRAAYLPEIGARLACRFELPFAEEPLEAEGEVVWAADAGARVGEFGVRFVGLDPRAEAALRALAGHDPRGVDDLHGAGGPYRVRSPHALREPNDVEGPLGAGALGPVERDARSGASPAAPAARLFLDGVKSPIVARVAHRAQDLLTVEQELPFLRLDKGVTVRDDAGDERRARIGSVDLELVGDVPRLVLQVVFDTAPASVPAQDDRTEPDLVAPSQIAAAARAAAPATVAPVPEASARRVRADEVRVVATPGGDDPRGADGGDDHDPGALGVDEDGPRGPRAAAPDAVEAALALHRARAAAMGEASAGPAAKDAASAARAAKTGARGAGTLEHRARAGAAAAGEALVPPLVRLRAAMAALALRARPSAERLLARSGQFAHALLARLGPAVSAALARGRALGRRVVLVARARLAKGATAPANAQPGKPRRTTAPAPGGAGAAPLPRATEAAPEPARAAPRHVGRYVLLGVFAAVGAGLGAYALRGDDRIDAALPAPAAPPAEVSEPTVASGDPFPGERGALADPARPEPAGLAAGAAAARGAGPPTLVAPASEAPAPASAVAPSTTASASAGRVGPPPTPTALPAPSYVAGHLPPPTYPTLQAAPRPQPAEALPAGSPYALDVRPEAVAGRDPTVGGRAAGVGASSAVAPSATPPGAQPAAATASSFGAATVPGGRSFTLRMTRPVAGLAGRRDPKGFDVRIEGALTLDRAAPIAASHPLVETAMIINRGDHADLSIRFRDGRVPPYRVVARGAAVEVVLGR